MKNLAKQILAIRKDANKRNIIEFATVVEKLIDKQIKLKKEEVSDLKEELETTTQDAELDFIDSLTAIEDTKITSTAARNSYAERYILDAIANRQTIDENIQTVKDDISALEKDIKALEDVKKIIDKLVVPVETDTTDKQ